MQTQRTDHLAAKKCLPSDELGPKYTRSAAQKQLKSFSGWQLTHAGQRIRKEWSAKDFSTAMKFFNAVAKVAEQQDHHPDLHLENYRRVSIELSTHAIGGLSENDFILAAKIDRLPLKLKKNA